MTRRYRTTSFCLAFVCMAAGGLGAQDRNSAPDSNAVHVRLGYPTQMFMDVDPRDAKVAFDLWVNEIIRSNRLPFTLGIVFFESPDEALAAAKAGQVELAALPTNDYLRIKDTGPIEPILSGSLDGKVGEEYLLLARTDRGRNSLEQLRGATLNLEAPYTLNPVVLKWLDVQLMRKGLEPADRFLGTIKHVSKPSQAILPVFFGQADACLVNRYAYRTIRDLNPQIERDFAVLATSPPFVASLAFVRKNVPEDLKASIRKYFNIMDSAKGRQIMALFKVDRTILFQPEHLESLIRLNEEYAALRSKPRPGNAPPSGPGGPAPAGAKKTRKKVTG